MFLSVSWALWKYSSRCLQSCLRPPHLWWRGRWRCNGDVHRKSSKKAEDSQNFCLVGGDWNMTFIFPIYWKQSSQLTFIFFRGVGIPPTSISLWMNWNELTWGEVGRLNWRGSMRRNEQFWPWSYINRLQFWLIGRLEILTGNWGRDPWQLTDVLRNWTPRAAQDRYDPRHNPAPDCH